MKKYTTLLLCLALVSCTYEQFQVQVGNASEKEYVLEVSIDEPATKSGVGEYGAFYWTSGDQLALYTTEKQFRTLKLKEGAGLSTATFAGTLNETEYPAEVAVFPASIVASYNDGKLEVVLPEKYDYNDDYAIGNPPMIAALGNDNGVMFKHLCAMLRFTIDQVPAGATSVRLSSKGSKLAGSFTFSFAENSALARKESDSGTSLAVGFRALDYPKTMVFSFPVPVGTYDNMTIEILDADKKTLWSREMSGSRTFTAGQLMVFDKISTFPKVIDLGLPSGTLWADRNIGANEPTGMGTLFAWAETDIKDDYTLANYKYADANGEMTKYNAEDGIVEIEPSEDIATIILGSDWRMPTQEEVQELLDNCTEEKQKNYAVYTGPNGESLILSYGGIKYDGNFYGGQGHYWTKTIYAPSWDSHRNRAYCLHLYSIFDTHVNFTDRYQGLLVRPVYVSTSHGFDITATMISIKKDESYDLDVSGTNGEGLIWKSENESIATVDNNGVVIGKAEGQTTIVVSSSDGKKKQSCVVRVVPDISGSVSIFFSGGAMYSINSVIQSGSVLNFTIKNDSSCGIRADRFILVDGVSGSEKAYAVNATVGAGESASYSLTVQSGGIQKPTCRFEYRYEGKTYSTACTVSVNF